MYYDITYFLYMIPAIAISIVAQIMVKSAFAKYNRVQTTQGLTGAQAARLILDSNGLTHVQVVQVDGELNDHYDPRANVVRLSNVTFGNASVGAVGVAAHECGHAVQHARGYAPLKIRSAIIPICNIGSALSVPLIFLGFFLNFLGLVTIGIILFSLAAVFQLVTLPVEFNASRRAINTLSASGMMNQQELSGAKKVLTAAALTYVAALLTSILQLLYYMSLGNRRRRN